MQITLEAANQHRTVDLALRHDPPRLPRPQAASKGELKAAMSLDLLNADTKHPVEVEVDLQTGELQLHDGPQSWGILTSRSADELRLTLYSRLNKAWETEAPLPAAAAELQSRLALEIQRLSVLEPFEQAPGLHQA